MRKRIFFLVLSIVSLFLTGWLELYFQRRQELIGGGINRVFLFLLINAHMIVCIILLYFIIRQSIKLFLERRKEVPGSAFKRNLFFAFTVFSVIPVIFVFFVAGKILTTSINNWFKARLGVGLEHSLLLHQQETSDVRARLAEAGKLITQRMAEKKLANLDDTEFTWYVWGPTGEKIVGSISDEVNAWRRFRRFNDRSTQSLRQVFLQELGKSTTGPRVFDFYGSLYFAQQISSPDVEPRFLIGAYRYPEAVRASLIEVQNSLYDYQQLTSFYHPIYWTYVSTFLLLTLLILVLSIWCAFYLARGISKPIQDLLEALGRLRKGNLNVRLECEPTDDLRYLAIGFNEMSQSLQSAHSRLEKHNQEMMTMLQHIKESIFFINAWGRIISHNAAAQKLIERYVAAVPVTDQKIHFLGEPIKHEFFACVRELHKSGKVHLSKEISFVHAGELKVFMVYVTSVHNALFGNKNGVLVIIDDVSDAYKMNKIKTWQEAAKQMAHEIKNPLTPIQLATQRMQRKLKAQPEADATMVECVHTILQQVTIIKDLVTHFSEFAKMPDTIIEKIDLNMLIKEIVALYEMSYPDIAFMCDLENFLPTFDADRNKMKRVIVNLLDNSTRILQQMKSQPYVEAGGAFMIKKIITIKTRFKSGPGQIEILISDNGPGIAKEVRESLFLPYVSTSNKNMGLGLAIVHDVVTQAGGSVSLAPSFEGATFQILLPV